MQVAEAVHRYGKSLGVSVLPIYGGASMENQLRTLKRGVDVVVATPGRALDHIRRKTLRLDSVKVVVLDEADEMLDMGFAEDLEAILQATPEERQTALFSATLPPRIAQIADKHLKDPVRVRIDREVVPAGSAPRVRQVAYIVARAHKIAALGRVLDVENPTSAIVFCRTRTEVDELDRIAQRPRLSRRGAARRPQPGAARSRDEEVPRQLGRSAHRHRRRRARARRPARLARRELRRAERRGGVRAPHRPHGPRRPRRRRDHARRAARASAAAQHRAADEAADRDRRRAHRGRPACAASRAHARIASRDHPRGRARSLPRGRRFAGPGVRHHGRGRRRGEAGRRRRRRVRRKKRSRRSRCVPTLRAARAIVASPVRRGRARRSRGSHDGRP